MKNDPQFEIVKGGLFNVVSTTFSRTLKKFLKHNVYELKKSFLQIAKKLLTGMREVTIDLDSTVSSVYRNQEVADKGYNPKKKD